MICYQTGYIYLINISENQKNLSEYKRLFRNIMYVT